MSAALHQFTHSNSSSSARFDLGQTAKDPQDVFQIYTQDLGEMMLGMCSFEGMELQVFSLFKSLISFGKPAQLLVKLDGKVQVAFFEFPQEEKEKIETYLNQLVALIRKEIAFKRVLKEIIANKNRFKSEQILLQKALFGDSEA